MGACPGEKTTDSFSISEPPVVVCGEVTAVRLRLTSKSVVPGLRYQNKCDFCLLNCLLLFSRCVRLYSSDCLVDDKDWLVCGEQFLEFSWTILSSIL